MLSEEDLVRRRRNVTIFSILFLMFINGLFIGPFLKIGVNILISIAYSGVLFVPKSWWTKKKLFIISVVLILVTVAAIYWFQEIKLAYFLAIIIFSISIQLSLSKSPVPAIVALVIAAMFYIRFGHENIVSLIPFLFVLIVLYFTIRMRMQRNEMYELNKEQLKKLQAAYEQLQEASVTSMQYAVLEERNRIAREIHDAVGHSLTSLIVQMQACKYMIKKDALEAEKSLDGMLVVARQGLNDIRTSVHSLADNQKISGITPLKALLSRMEISTSIRYEFHSELEDQDLNMNHSAILFKVLQEAITNIIRHAGATFVHVSLKKEAGRIVMHVCDNGELGPSDKVNEGFGIKGMKARLEERGGRLHYSIMEPNGFELTAEIPFDSHLEKHKENEG